MLLPGYEVFHIPELEGHITRVQQLTEMLINKHNERCGLNLSTEYIDYVLYASVLHDIGKTGIPESILFKPGKLTEAERTIIETHTLIGAYIVSKYENASNPRTNIVKNVVLHHHEKFDGSGYPYHLSGTEIPFEARIIAVVDVFDALTSKRCYKEGWSVEDTLQFLDMNKGSHFDPELVDSFLLLEEELSEYLANQSFEENVL